MKQKVASGIGGCLLLAFLLFVCPIRGRAADTVKVTDDDKGVKVQYELSSMESEDESTGTVYSAKISFVDADANPTELNIKSEVQAADGTSYTIKEVEDVDYKNSIQTIKIDEGIISVNAYALTSYSQEGSSLKNVQFPSTLEDVTSPDGEGFVAWDTHPDTVVVPEWLKNMMPEDGVVYAGKVAIYVPQAENDADKVGEITFKEGCTKIAHKALFGNKDVKKVNIPASVKTIGGAAFDGCSNLSVVNFAENAQLEDMDWRAFYDCTALTAVKIPDSVTRIGTETFSGCTSLEKADISEKSSLTLIEYGAFGYYPYEVDLQEGVGAYLRNLKPEYGYTSRENAGTKIKEIYLPAAALHFYSNNYSAAGLFAGCTTLERVTIGNSGDVKAELPMEMFAGCTALKELCMNGNVKTIGTGAFVDCANLTSVDFTGTEELKPYSFVRTGITEVTIPSTVKKVGAFSFASCTKLTTMNLRSSLPQQDSSVYLNQIIGGRWSVSQSDSTKYSGYEAVKILEPKRTALRKLNVYMDDSTGKTAIDGRNMFATALYSLEEVTLPEEMTEIPENTFSFCFSLKKADLPASIQNIGEKAFQFDLNLDVDFSRLTNLETIGEYAFMLQGNEGQAAMKEIILPNSLKSVGYSAFYGQEKATKVVIPESVTSIGYAAFQKLSALQTLEIYGKNTIMENYGWNYDLLSSQGFNSTFWNVGAYPEPGTPATMTKIVLGKDLSETGKIENSLFYNSSLKEADIQMDNIQNIGNAMFMNSKKLESFTIPETVKTIDQAAFYGTDSLKEMTIPENVTTMDVEVFRNSGLKKVWILNKDLIIKEPTTEDVSEAEAETKTKVTLKSEETVKDYLAIPENITIYGLAGSTAETYAKAHGNKFVSISQVTFDTQDGNKASTQLVGNGEKLARPQDPEREDYVFVGWYTDKACTIAFDFETDMINKDTTLYAKWKNAFYTVSFESNGGSQVLSQTVAYKGKVTKPEDPKREHYVFAGWYKEKGCTTEYDFGKEIVEDAITLYAKWDKEIYTVSFESNGGSQVTGQQVAYEGQVTKPEDPKKEHYVFAGWYTDKDCKTAFDFETKVESTTTLYAKWDKAIYTVSFESNGGSSVSDQQVAYEGQITKPEDPKREHYVFAGWYTDKDCKTVFDFETKVESTTTLYAKWEKAIYTISFESNEGSQVDSQQIAYEGKVTKPEDPTKAHYIFGGWYTDEACNTEFDFATEVGSNIKLYAKWEKEVYTVSFESNEGSQVDSQQIAYEGKVTKPENPTRAHYIFGGWYTDEACNTEFDFATEVGSNIKLYARWEKEVYTVSFESNGGSKVNSQQIAYEEKVVEPEAPVKVNYTFAGWYKEKGCTTQFNFAKDVIESNVTLYAKWNKKEPVISKNMVISSGKYTYKVTKTSKNQGGTVEFSGNVKGKETGTVTVPNTIKINGKKYKVTSIAPKAFANNKKVEKIVIGNNVKTIKKKAFYNARNLKKITIGKNVTTIQSQAFGRLPKLEKIIIKSKKLKRVHKKAFSPLKRKLVIKIYKKPVVTNNGKTSTVPKSQLIIKVPKSKKVKYEKLFKACKR